MSGEWYRLPYGETTRSKTRYAREWDKLRNTIEEALGVEVIALDPDLIVKKGNDSCRIPMWIAQKIVALHETVRDLNEELNDVSAKHNELLDAVERKFPDEQQHETALRYIQEAEKRASDPGSCAEKREEQRG